MAVRVLKTSCKYSASATNNQRVEASNLSLPTNANWNTANYWQTMNSTRTLNVTFASNGNQQGITMWVKGCYTGTLTIVLREGTTVRTTDVFDLTANPLHPSSWSSVYAGWHYFPLTSYAVTTAAGWNYQITASSATPTAVVTTSGGTDFIYAVNLDADTSAISSSDTTIIADGVALSMDQTATHAATNGHAIIQCIDSVYRCLNADLSGTTTLTINGDICSSFSSKFYLGSDGTTTDPISLTNRLTVDFSGNGAAYLFNQGISSSYFGGNCTNAIEIYGAEDTYIGTRVASLANSGQTHIITTVDMSGQWANGDHLCVIGKVKPGVLDSTNYTISSISGTDITLNTNLDYPVLAGAGIVNQDRKDECGVQITSLSTQSVTTSTSAITGHLHLVGCYLYKCAINGGITRRINKNNLIRNVLYDDQGATSLSGIIYLGSSSNSTFSGIYHFSTRTTYMAILFFYNIGNNNTVSNIFTKNTYYATSSAGTIHIGGNGNTVSGLVHAGSRYTATTYNNMYLSGASNTITDIFDYSMSGISFTLLLVNSTIDGLITNGSLGSSLNFSNSIGLMIKNAQIGNTTAAGVSEFITAADTINQVILISPLFNASPTAMVTGLDVALPGSYIRVSNYNGTANDNRGYESFGNYVSTGAGLVGDTTVHTTGGFPMRIESTSSTDRQEWVQSIPTGNIQNKTMMVGVWCNINNSAYWGGTHQLPRLTVNYDDGTIAYTQASETTGWQFLPLPITPTTTYGQITATVSTMTDATGSNAYVYFADYVVLYPAGVQLNLGLMSLWANGIPIMPTIATNLSANDVWSASDTTDYGSSTIGNRVKKLKNPSLIIDGELVI